ncbi:hypothetical protein [Lentzea atacamensis]|nr:hypothetical protein [Lentzea atacamensis]
MGEVAMTVAARHWMAGVPAYQGVWAAAFPLSFYNDFPGPGLHWVAALSPYNEHLARKVGALNLALMVLSVWARRRSPCSTPPRCPAVTG